jgi:hypothetical protein
MTGGPRLTASGRENAHVECTPGQVVAVFGIQIFAPSVGVLCGGDSVWRLMPVGVYVDAFNLRYGVVLSSPRASIFKRSEICSGTARSA